MIHKDVPGNFTDHEEIKSVYEYELFPYQWKIQKYSTEQFLPILIAKFPITIVTETNTYDYWPTNTTLR